MTEQRLSMLQRWILLRAYENKIERKKRYGLDDGGCVTKVEIYRDFFHLSCRTGKSAVDGKAFFSEDPKSASAVLSRSLQNLFRKGLVCNAEWEHRSKDIECEYRGKKFLRRKPGRFFKIALTPEGEEKVKEILS